MTGLKAGFGRVYYGWIIVGVAMVSLAFWFGIRGAFSVFYVALLEEFPWSRGGAAGVQSTALITYTIMAPLAGGLIDRFGPRRVIVPGIVLMALGLILCAWIESLVQFYFLFGVLAGTGATSIGVVSVTAILAHWFERRRGAASGLAVSGVGLGAFILVPLSQNFISLWGWRLAFVALGLLALIVVLPLNAFFLKHKPQDLGLYPDGMEEGVLPKAGRMEPLDNTWSETDWTLMRAARTRRFWALMIFPFCVITGVYIVLVHHVRFLVDAGVDKMTAAFIFAFIGVISSAFRIFWGWLSDSIGREKTFTLGVMCVCTGICLLLLLETTGKMGLVYLFVIFFGSGWGVTAPMFMSVAADLFQGRRFGLIYGLVEGSIGMGCALGAWIAGFIFDITQSYQWAFILAASISMVSCVFVWLAAPRKVRQMGKMPVMEKG